MLADKTGYDPDTLEMGMELETELGIDSIKRVEILSEVQDRLGVEAQDVAALALQTRRRCSARHSSFAGAEGGEGSAGRPVTRALEVAARGRTPKQPGGARGVGGAGDAGRA